MGDIKEKVSVKVVAGIVNVDDVDAISDAIQQQTLQAAAALKARGVSTAKLTLNFVANIES
jgi:hypothetical protein